MKRAQRRQALKKIKKKVQQRFERIHKTKISKKLIGKLAQVHGSDCSCFRCGNPRKYYNEKTLQERRNEQPEE